MTISDQTGTDNVVRKTYASLAEANAILNIHPTYSTGWKASTTTDAKRADLLAYATMQIDRFDYIGMPVSADPVFQPLKFPRTGLPDGYLQGDINTPTLVPLQIVRATALLAGGYLLAPPSATLSPIAQGIEEVGAGSARVKFRARSQATQQSDTLIHVNAEAWELLEPLLASTDTSRLRAIYNPGTPINPVSDDSVLA